MSSYQEVYESWKKAPTEFWANAAQEIEWVKPADKVFNPDMGVYGRWFAGCRAALPAGRYPALCRSWEAFGRR